MRNVVTERTAAAGSRGEDDGASPPVAPDDGRPRLLVVDDEEDIREMFAFVFGREGWVVVLAASGKEAVRAAERSAFDVAITDLRMPGMSGPETITALRALQPRLRVLVATGYASDETAADCFRRGAVDYIKKPFDLAELLERVKRQLV